MSDQATLAPTLFELLARTWSTEAAIQSLIFNQRQTAVGFALDTGILTIAHVSDEDPAEQRIHVSAEDGRSTIRPRAKLPKPLISIEVAKNGPILLGRLGETGFIAGGLDAPLYRISLAGDKTKLNLETDGPMVAIDDYPGDGRLACADKSGVTLFDSENRTTGLRLGGFDTISGIRFSSDGGCLAISHRTGLSIRSLDGNDKASRDVVFDGRPNAIHWSPDGSWIAVPLTDGGFQLISVQDGRTRALTDYPAPVESIAWNGKANALLTSGAFRMAAWSMDNPPIEDASTGALETGKTGFVTISSVASHPQSNLVAGGYDNGFVSIMQIGGSDELVLNSEDHGAVTSLEWSRDGKHIACGTDKGLAALISTPRQMFK